MPGRPASTCWVTSRWSVFSVRRTSCKLRPFSKKTGAERPFRQAGEMWCEQDSKRAKDVDMTASDLEIAREIVRVPGTGHDPVLASGDVSPLYTETLVTW